MGNQLEQSTRVPSMESPFAGKAAPSPDGAKQIWRKDKPAKPTSHGRYWLIGAVGVAVIGGIALLVALKASSRGPFASSRDAGTRAEMDSGSAAGLPVNTIRPRLKTLERTLMQPGSIKPWAQAELYAKASGYLKFIQRAPTPRMAADILAQSLAVTGPTACAAVRMSSAIHTALLQSPQKDIGSTVRAGEVLLEIATPELDQAIVEKESFVQQRQAELAAARAALATFEAAVEVAKAQKLQAEADIRKFQSEHTFRGQELKRLKELTVSKTIAEEIADEKQHQVNAALGAWESSQAKVNSAQADLAVVSSKLTAASADLKVKEVLVQVARDELSRTIVQAEFSRLHAPFDGIITYRHVDEGDFIQNATSGQPRRLMTITALEKVKVVLQVPEKDAPWVRVGAEASVVVDARLGKHANGRIARTASCLDSATRTLRVEIDLDNQDHFLIPEMYGQVRLTLEKIENAQAIPATALYSRKGENFILLAKDGVAHRQRVRVRYDDGKEVEVVKVVENRELPLDGSEELIVSNKGEIAEGQRLKPSPLAGE